MIGLFFDDTDRINSKGKLERFRERPRLPETGWKAPKDFPNLFHEKILGLDVETYDPELLTHGAGWARGVGHIVGVSLATASQAWYFPIRHETMPEDNLCPVAVFKYLADLLGKTMPKVGANILYDLGWLQQEGVAVKGITYDIQYAEALLVDNALSYSLETIANQYLNQGKDSNELYQWLAEWFGGPADGKQRKHIYKSPPNLCGPYAEADAKLPVQILLKQREKLVNDGLWDLFEMECKLIPVLLGMRFRGMPVDVEKAERVEIELQQKIDKHQEDLNTLAGFEVDVNIKPDLIKLFDKFGVKYPVTDKGNPSFTKKFLATNASPQAKAIIDIRKHEKIKTTFVRGAILDKNIEGKVYPTMHPLRGENGGAVSGRYSSSQPNGQNIPSRDKILAPMVRGIFVPENGFDQWIKFDFAQIEYRIFAHVSNNQELIDSYSDPTIDYHDMVSKMLNDVLPRKVVKRFNFMSLFAGGRKKTIEMVGEELTEIQVEEMCHEFGLPCMTKNQALTSLGNSFVDLYAKNFPAAKTTLDYFSNLAAETGEVRTLLNRKSIFDQWESSDRNNHDTQALSFAQAHNKYGNNIRRANCYRALNRVTQGGSADMLKKGMLDAYEAGLFAPDKLGYPHILVHDELDFSFNNDLIKEAKELKLIMEQAIPLKVPVIMDVETGPNWGDLSDMLL